MLPVVFLVIDRAAVPIELMFDMPMLASGQMSGMVEAVAIDLAVNAAFAALKPGGFAGSELAGSDALPDAMLLIAEPGIDRSMMVRIGLCCNGDHQRAEKQRRSQYLHKNRLHKTSISTLICGWP